MLLIALTPASRDGGAITVKMLGVLLASLSSGGGELSFLGLTHYYGHFSLAAWGSGTGGAGLIGAGAYVVATTWLGLSVRTSLLAFSFLPVIMLLSFFVILPRGPLKARIGKHPEYQGLPGYESDDFEPDDGIMTAETEEAESLLSTSLHSSTARSFTAHNRGTWRVLSRKLARSRGLFFP